MRTYNVTMQGQLCVPPDNFDALDTEKYPAIEAESEHDALERAMLLYEMDHPFNGMALHWRVTIDGVPFRLFWFLYWDPITGERDYPDGAGIFGGIDRVPSRTR